MMVNNTILLAMRATHLPTQTLKLWTIRRFDLSETIQNERVLAWTLHKYGYARYPSLAPITTGLYHWTDATLHQDGGECVMSDDPRELRKHLPALRVASGRVLVSGLGLGCVVRGLLACSAVTLVGAARRSA